MDNVLIIAGLILAGLGLVVLEILTPSFGIIATMAIAAFGGAIWMAYSVSSTVGAIVLVALAAVVPVYCYVLIKTLPNTKIGGLFFLAKAREGAGEAQPDAPRYSALVGKVGEAVTLLRPSGAVRIDGQRYFAIAENGQIDAGTPISVVKFDGMDIIVRPAAQEGDRKDAAERIVNENPGSDKLSIRQ